MAISTETLFSAQPKPIPFELDEQAGEFAPLYGFLGGWRRYGKETQEAALHFREFGATLEFIGTDPPGLASPESRKQADEAAEEARE